MFHFPSVFRHRQKGTRNSSGCFTGTSMRDTRYLHFQAALTHVSLAGNRVQGFVCRWPARARRVSLEFISRGPMGKRLLFGINVYGNHVMAVCYFQILRRLFVSAHNFLLQRNAELRCIVRFPSESSTTVWMMTGPCKLSTLFNLRWKKFLDNKARGKNLDEFLLRLLKPIHHFSLIDIFHSIILVSFLF